MPAIDRRTAGVYVIAATPFAEDGALDLGGIDGLVDSYVEAGCDGMTILGVMGEATKLAADESRTVMRRFLARAPEGFGTIVGVSAPGLDNLARLGKEAMEAGAAGVMIAPIPGLATEAAVLAYYAQACEMLGPDVPVCFQDYPQLTGVKVTADTILELTRRHPQIVMLKHEDCPGLNKLTRVREGSDVEGTERLSILCGNGGLHLCQELARGADGAMTGFAFPEMMVDVVRLHAEGRADAAEDLFDAWLPLVRHEVQPGLGLALRKETLRRRGVIRSAKVRAPGPSLTAADLTELDRLISRAKARVPAAGGRISA